MERILLAYAGDRSTIPWLRSARAAEVIALVADVGQGPTLEDVRDRALALGAARAHVIDVREELARDFILPALQAGAFDRDPALAQALVRAVVARHAVAIASIEGAKAIAHGARGAGRDAFARLLGSLDPNLAVIAPDRSGAADDEAMANIWGRSIAAVAGADGSQDVPEDRYVLTKSPEEAPASAAHVEIAFEAGAPVSINGIVMSPVELIQSLETIAGAHAAGRSLRIGVGAASGGCEALEAPAAVVLHAAHRDLQRALTPPDLTRIASTLSLTYADLVEAGGWFTPSRRALQAFVTSVQAAVTGTVRIRLYKGDARVVSVQTAASAAPQPCKL
jgi:argininosuccinate synthase